MESALAEAREGGKKLYISFDVDVLDPAFVPGTGTPIPGVPGSGFMSSNDIGGKYSFFT